MIGYHPNIVKLIGYCLERNTRMLALLLELAPHGSAASLLGEDAVQLPLHSKIEISKQVDNHLCFRINCIMVVNQAIDSCSCRPSTPETSCTPGSKTGKHINI